MKIASHPQDRLRMGLAQHHGASQTRQHLALSKTPVEMGGRLGHIAPGVLFVAIAYHLDIQDGAIVRQGRRRSCDRWLRVGTNQVTVSPTR